MNRLTIFIYSALIFTCVIVPARAEEGAPFGLAWSATKEQVEELGVKLTPLKKSEDGENFVATNLPKILNDVESVQLSFGFNDALHRVAALSDSFDNDPYGSAVKSRYQSLSILLTRKYGQGDVKHYQNTEIWKDADEFLMGLMQGRSWHYTNFIKGDISVQLGVRASGSSKGYYILIYQNEELKKRVKEQSSENEGDAL